MPRLHYHFLISNTDLTTGLEPISAAGQPGFQHFTPVLDVEHLLYGRVLSEGLPPEVSTSLYTGAHSPVVAARALLLEIQRTHDVIVHVYDLGVGQPWTFDAAQSSFPATLTRGPAKPAQLRQWLQRTPPAEVNVDFVARRDCQRAGNALFAMIQSMSSTEDYHLIAECVPGGTLTANIALNHALGLRVSSASSSNDPATLANRITLIEQLTNATFERPGLAADHFQLTLKHFFAAYLSFAGRKEGTRICLGGGSQMLAPFTLANLEASSTGKATLQSDFELVTTPWIARSPDLRPTLQLTQPFTRLSALTSLAINFNDAKDRGWQIYEQGFAKEGCGMGALLWFAALHIPYSPAAILATLDRATQKASA